MARTTPFLLVASSLGAVVALTGCPPSPKPDPSAAPSASGPSAIAPTPSAAPAPSAAATPSASASAPALPPVCKVSNQKVWGAGANKLTGLTTRNMGSNRVAIGFAFGVTPHVLLVNKGGGGQVIKVQTKAGSKFATPPKPGEGTRHLMRVTPFSVEDAKATALMDFRDEYKDKKRVVACGSTEDAEPFVVFEGTSYLDLKDKPTGDERKKLFSSKIRGLEGYAELRDCRSFFSNRTKETWAIGSELHGIEKDDKVEWKAALVLDAGPKETEQVLHKVNLKDDPPRSGFQFEVPASVRVKDKGYVLTTRFGGSLLVGVLDEKRKLSGAMKSYPGLPLLADLSRTDTHVIVNTAIATAPSRFGLRALLIPIESMELPKGYTSIKIDDDHEDSESNPELVITSKGQRWMAYIEGPRDKGHLEILPINAELKRVGRPHPITEDEERASEARVVPMDDGDLLVAYLRDKDGKTELVTEEMSCEVKN
jgi:hypothetical protein